MPWMETHVMDQRTQFIAAYLKEESVAQLSRQFGISRKTAYKWIGRYQADGPPGLVDRSSAPHCHPNQFDPDLLQAVLDYRDKHPLWGPKKLLKVLIGKGDPRAWPSRSTVASWLKTHGRSFDRKKRRRVAPQSQPLSHATGPNSLWCCDFKGWFYAGHTKCHPLTITDAFSRYLLRCHGLTRTDFEAVKPIFESAFREYGLPESIRSDNGPPFASRALAGLSRLSIWWIRLGIRHERIEPGKPQQNGRHERMHLTLKQEVADPAADSLAMQQQRLKSFRLEYNEVRPHEALDMATPDSLYLRSPRELPARLAPLEYPDGWQLRRVESSGDISWKNVDVFVSEVLHRETVGLDPLDDRLWRAYFGPVFLGVLDTHKPRLLSGAALRNLDRKRLREGLPAASPAAALPPSAALQESMPQQAKV